MSWVWVYLRARLVPLVGSLLLVAVVNGLLPGALVVWLLGSLLFGVVATRAPFWRLIHGVRRPTPEENAIVRAAAGMVPGLRGRDEPIVWVWPGHGLQVARPGPGEVAVSFAWVRAVALGTMPVEALAAAVAAATGRSVVRRPWTSALDVACWPARVVAAPFEWVGRHFPDLGRLCTGWLLATSGIAMVMQASTQRWTVLASVACFALAVIAAPLWSRGWQRAHARLGIDAARHAGLAAQLPAADGVVGPEWFR